jgi:hypothetical protein
MVAAVQRPSDRGRFWGRPGECSRVPQPVGPNNTDRYQLLDLCARTDTLIADTDGFYHPPIFNDRLVLGLKATMREAELSDPVQAELRHKAARDSCGSSCRSVRLRRGRSCRDHSRRAQVKAIATVFRRFADWALAGWCCCHCAATGCCRASRRAPEGRCSMRHRRHRGT